METESQSFNIEDNYEKRDDEMAVDTKPEEENKQPIKKFIGHNKLQLRIQELNNEMIKLNNINKEKDMQINLLRRTISNLQTNLQDKTNKITELTNILNDTSNVSNTKNENLQILNTDVKNLKIEIDNLNKDKETLTITLGSIRDENESLKSTQITLQKQIVILEADNGHKGRLIENLKDEKEQILKDTELQKSLYSNMQNEFINLKNELVSLKSDVDKYQDKTIKLSKEVDEKDNLINLINKEANPSLTNIKKIGGPRGMSKIMSRGFKPV